jgi:ABC-2 type transport system ATP-binding protein
MHDGAVTVNVPDGEQFVPRLFAELGVGIQTVSVSRPTLDDVFVAYTGSTITDVEAAAGPRMRTAALARVGRR